MCFALPKVATSWKSHFIYGFYLSMMHTDYTRYTHTPWCVQPNKNIVSVYILHELFDFLSINKKLVACPIFVCCNKTQNKYPKIDQFVDYRSCEEINPFLFNFDEFSSTMITPKEWTFCVDVTTGYDLLWVFLIHFDRNVWNLLSKIISNFRKGQNHISSKWMVCAQTFYQSICSSN